MLKVVLFCLGILVSLAQPGYSAIVLSVAQLNPGPITVGNTVDFTVSIRSNSGNINTLAMLGFTVSVGAGGGRFVSGTGLYTPGSHTFNGPPPSGALPSNVVGYLYSAGSGQPVSGTISTAIASFRLDTTNATIGNYSLSLTAADAADIGFSSLGAVTPAPFNYSIAAVPEPSTMLLVPVGVAILGRRLLKRRKS